MDSTNTAVPLTRKQAVDALDDLRNELLTTGEIKRGSDADDMLGLTARDVWDDDPHFEELPLDEVMSKVDGSAAYWSREITDAVCALLGRIVED